jgi:uncharacterized membrane protein
LNKNPIIEKYLKEVQDNIYNLVESEKFIDSLRESIYEFVDGKDDLTLEDLIAEFGTPEDIADEYLSDEPDFEPSKLDKSDSKRKLIIGAIIIGIIAAIGILLWVTHAPTDVPVYEMPIQHQNCL